MFDQFGQPKGYGQIAPGRDQPKATPRQATPLQNAIVGAPNYPTDPSLASWRQGGEQKRIGDVQGHAQSQFGNLAPNAQGLESLLDSYKQGGVNVVRPTRAGGVLSGDKLEFPDYGYGVDFIVGSDGDNPTWGWQPYSLRKQPQGPSALQSAIMRQQPEQESDFLSLLAMLNGQY